MLTFSRESEAFQLPLIESDGKPLATARLTSSVGVSSSDTLVVSAGFPCQDLSVAGRKKGLTGSRSSLGLTLIGSLSKTSGIRGGSGCPNCGADYSSEGMPACRFECEPRTLERPTSVPESSWLPTPTASSYGSCRGGGSGRVGQWRPSLSSMARNNRWPTPRHTDGTKGIRTAAGAARERERLPNGEDLGARAGGYLNPTWVEWLMGFPLNHTASKPSVMPSSRTAPNSCFEE